MPRRRWGGITATCGLLYTIARSIPWLATPMPWARDAWADGGGRRVTGKATGRSLVEDLSVTWMRTAPGSTRYPDVD